MLTREGRGEEPNQTTARKPVLYKSFKTLWEGASLFHFYIRRLHDLNLQFIRKEWTMPRSVYAHMYIDELYTEAEFLDVVGTKVLRIFLLGIHSHFY